MSLETFTGKDPIQEQQQAELGVERALEESGGKTDFDVQIKAINEKRKKDAQEQAKAILDAMEETFARARDLVELRRLLEEPRIKAQRS